MVNRNKEITPAQVANIQVANAKEIEALNEQVMGATATIAEADRELEALNQSLAKLSNTKKKYDEKADKARRKMQRLIPSL